MPKTAAEPAEVARYNALADTWWDPKGPMWPLHKLNALRAPFVLKQVCQHYNRVHDNAAPLAGITLLDIGCGAGLLAEEMAKAGATVTGVDAAERNIQIATEHAARSGLEIEYLHGTVEAITDRQFDVVLNMEVVEHVVDLAAFVGACNACVTAGGMQVVATINRNPKSFLFAILGAEYVLRWLPRGTHQWHKFVKPNELERLFAADDLRVEHRCGVSVNPFTRRYSLTRDTSVNYMLVASRSPTA